MKARPLFTESDVLFQKLGDTWFAFAEINNEVVYSALPKGIDPKSTKLEFYGLIKEHIKKVHDIRASMGA